MKEEELEVGEKIHLLVVPTSRRHTKPRIPPQ
jgi:hypothetical protein